MNRLLLYTPAAERTLNRMDRPDAERIIHALETFAAAGHGDVKALKGSGRYRLRVGKWRIFWFSSRMQAARLSKRPWPARPGCRAENRLAVPLDL